MCGDDDISVGVEQLLEAEWQRYRSTVVTLKAGEAQLQDLRHAFYDGALVAALMMISIPGASENTVRFSTGISDAVRKDAEQAGCREH